MQDDDRPRSRRVEDLALDVDGIPKVRIARDHVPLDGTLSEGRHEPNVGSIRAAPWKAEIGGGDARDGCEREGSAADLVALLLPRTCGRKPVAGVLPGGVVVGVVLELEERVASQRAGHQRIGLRPQPRHEDRCRRAGGAKLGEDGRVVPARHAIGEKRLHHPFGHVRIERQGHERVGARAVCDEEWLGGRGGGERKNRGGRERRGECAAHASLPSDPTSTPASRSRSRIRN